MARRILPISLLIALVALWPGQPSAAVAASPALTLSATAAVAGTFITVRGSGLPRSASLRLMIDGRPLDLPSVRTGSTGRFAVRIRMPAVAEGRHRIGVRRPWYAGRPRPVTLASALLTVHRSVGPVPTPTLHPGPTPTGPPGPTAGPTPDPAAGPSLAGCPMLPASNVWNQPVTSLPVRADSATLVASIGATAHLHPDFGSYAGYGIPYNLVDSATPRVSVTFDYADESDQIPYPLPASPLQEAGSDGHILLLDQSACQLYELYNASRSSTGHWTAGSGASWDLRRNALRPDGWTSADAAGLPILPGLVRYDEVAAGLIAHAIRFTAPTTGRAHVYPARHDASSSTSTALPPMGLRLRLRASYDLSQLPPQARVIADAMQRYGIILADNGSPWFFSGASDPRFDDAQLDTLKAIPGSAFEALDTASLVNP